MNDFKFVSEEYSIQNSKNYRLSIQLNPDGFSVLVTNEDRKVLKILHQQTGSLQNTRQLFKNREDLVKLRELSFKSVLILLNNEKISLIPDNEDYKDKRWNFYYLDFEKTGESKILNSRVEGSGISCSFEIDHELHSLIRGFRNKPSIKHISTSLIARILSGSKEGMTAMIYSSPGLLHIAVGDKGSLEFYNAFKWETEEEMLFHLMNVLRKFTVNELSVEYFGHLKKNGSSFKLLKKYIPKLQILPNVFSFEIAWDVNENYFGFLYPGRIADN
jgi:hypothetical protein